MDRKLVAALAAHAEDIALAFGSLAVAGGLGWKVGWWAALVAVGVLALLYGVVMTRWSSKEGGAEWASQAQDEQQQ